MAKSDLGKGLTKLINAVDKFVGDIRKNANIVLEAAKELRDLKDKGKNDEEDQ